MEKKEVPLGVEIQRTSNLIRSYLDTHVNGKIPLGMTGVEGMTLKCICKSNHPINASELRESTKVSKATTSQTLSSLERKGLVVMETSPSDKRVKYIRPTDKGKEVFFVFLEKYEKLDSLIVKGITNEEKKELIRILGKIQENLSGPDSQQ